MRQLANLLLTLLTTVGLAAAALAQDAAKYPEQMVRLVVPFSAGSMTDLLARVVAEKLQQRWNKDVVVENRPGLAGTASVAKAAPDGYTLMLSSNGHTVIGHLNKNLAFDPVRDFVGVTQVAVTPLILVVPPDLRAEKRQGTRGSGPLQAGRSQLQFGGVRQHDGHRRSAVPADDQDRYRAPALQGTSRNAYGDYSRRRRDGVFFLCGGG